jgi:peptidyl-prolyl cis-trans isomerase SurA
MTRWLGAVALGLMMAVATALPAVAAVVVTVNGQPISDVQISQRLKLLQLEGRSGTATAKKELIDEALMLQEAARLNIEIDESRVDDALQSVSRNLKMSMDNLRKVLQQNGVNEGTLRDRLKAALAWNEVTTIAVMPRIQFSDVDLEQKAEAKLTAAMSYDYILKEVLFVIPAGKGSASKRTAEANNYRKSFQGCDSAVKLALSYTDAAVIEIGRRHATQMPEAIANELSKLNVGGVTKPRVVENGVSMYAICAKSEAEDTTFIKSNLRAEVGNAQLKEAVAAYLEEVRAKAKIIEE